MSSGSWSDEYASDKAGSIKLSEASKIHTASPSFPAKPSRKVSRRLRNGSLDAPVDKSSGQSRVQYRWRKGEDMGDRGRTFNL